MSTNEEWCRVRSATGYLYRRCYFNLPENWCQRRHRVLPLCAHLSLRWHYLFSYSNLPGKLEPRALQGFDTARSPVSTALVIRVQLQ